METTGNIVIERMAGGQPRSVGGNGRQDGAGCGGWAGKRFPETIMEVSLGGFPPRKDCRGRFQPLQNKDYRHRRKKNEKKTKNRLTAEAGWD